MYRLYRLFLLFLLALCLGKSYAFITNPLPKNLTTTFPAGTPQRHSTLFQTFPTIGLQDGIGIESIILFGNNDKIHGFQLASYNGETYYLLSKKHHIEKSAKLHFTVGEYINQATVCTQEKDTNHSSVRYMEVTSSEQRRISLGNASGSDCVTWTAPRGEQLGGFCGAYHKDEIHLLYGLYNTYNQTLTEEYINDPTKKMDQMQRKGRFSDEAMSGNVRQFTFVMKKKRHQLFHHYSYLYGMEEVYGENETLTSIYHGGRNNASVEVAITERSETQQVQRYSREKEEGEPQKSERTANYTVSLLPSESITNVLICGRLYDTTSDEEKSALRLIEWGVGGFVATIGSVLSTIFVVAIGGFFFTPLGVGACALATSFVSTLIGVRTGSELHKRLDMVREYNALITHVEFTITGNETRVETIGQLEDGKFCVNYTTPSDKIVKGFHGIEEPSTGVMDLGIVYDNMR